VGGIPDPVDPPAGRGGQLGCHLSQRHAKDRVIVLAHGLAPVGFGILGGEVRADEVGGALVTTEEPPEVVVDHWRKVYTHAAGKCRTL
jgi:hypothetical protein